MATIGHALAMYLRRVDVARLVKLRARRGLSMAELARQSGVSYSMIKYIHAGQKQPSNEIAEKIAKALHVEITAFSVADHTAAARVPRRARGLTDAELESDRLKDAS
jgi:transcriptional regulator with XRE-family HTH domain